MAPTTKDWLSALRSSHDRLVTLVEKLSPEEIAGPSYCSDWSVAQVLSHLGSGAEIGLGGLEAAINGDPPPPRERNVEIWARWDALSPDEMASQAIMSDQQHVSRLESLTPEALEELRLPGIGGREIDAAGFIANRLHEHVAHTWDVEVMGDSAATVQQGAVELLIDRLPDRLGRLARGAKPSGLPTGVRVSTSEPTREITLRIADEEVAVDADAAADTTVNAPAEAVFRLALGRLDADHTPAGVSASGPVSLDELRELFAGS